MKNNLLLFFFCLFIYPVCFAQKQLIFKSFTTANGLPSNYVLSVKQDGNGYIWIGTDKGLAKFDGYKWQSWDIENGFPGNYIDHIEEDKHGGIWMHIYTKGIVHFDGIKSTYYLKDPVENSSRKMMVTTNGDLLLITDIIPTKSIKGTLLTRSKPLNAEEVFSFTGDEENFQISPDEHKIFFINYKNLQQAEKAINFSGKWKLQPSNHYFTNNNHNYFFPDDNTTLSKTLILLDKQKHQPPKEIIVSAYAPQVYCNGNLYIADRINGLSIIANNIVTQITSKDGLGTNYINDLSATKQGVVMIATMGQGLLFYEEDIIAKYILNNEPVKQILSAEDGIYLLAGDKVFYQASQKDSFKYSGVRVINATNLAKKGNSLFVGSYTGWMQYRISKNQFLFANQVIHNFGNSGLFITDSFTYASTYGRGLLRFKKNQFVDSLNFPFTIIEKLFSLQNGFAASSYDNGVVICINNTSQHLTKKELLSNAVYHVFEDGNNLWISTTYGINHLLNGSVTEKFTTADGFNGTRAVYSFKDSADRLWVLSDNFLHIKNGERLVPVKSFQTNTNGKDEVVSAAFDKQKQQLYIGTNKHLLIIDIWKIHPDTNIVTPAFLNIMVDGTVIDGVNFHVPASFQNILFSFAPTASKIIAGFENTYKLSGLDDAWHPMPDSLKISFAGLRAGKYDLLIQTANADGFLSPVKTVAQFIVKPPFWSTAWFIALCILIGSLITGIIIWQIQKVKQLRIKKIYENEQKIVIEKQRISRDLHDNLGANLIHIISKIDNLRNNSAVNGDKEFKQKTDSLNEEARNSIQLLRETVWTIKEDKILLKDFVLRIRIYLQRIFEEKKEITWDLQFTGNGDTHISPEKSLHIFRIIQESVNNILRHAEATTIKVNIVYDGITVSVAIKDNGKGFIKNESKSPNSFGLLNIEYRTKQIGGGINITSQPQQGTEVTLILPANM